MKGKKLTDNDVDHSKVASPTVRDIARHLSKGDLLDLLDLLEEARKVATEGHLRHLMHTASRLLPVERIHVSVAALDRESRIEGTSRHVNINYPTQWLKHYRSAGLQLIDPVGRRLFNTEKPVVWSQLRKLHSDQSSQTFFEMAKDFGLIDGFSFGARFARSTAGSFFTCEGKELTGHKRHLAIASYLLPYLHDSLARVHMSVAKEAAILTEREREVLNWVKFGKTDSDVAMLLGTKSRTIKFHVENAMRKLHAGTRTEAVARALAQGLIGWD